MGDDGGSTDHSALRHQTEQDRIDERRRRRGQQMVDAYFDGGRYATGDAVSDFESLDPAQTYYTPTGDEWQVPAEWVNPTAARVFDFDTLQELHDAGGRDIRRFQSGGMSRIGNSVSASDSGDEEFKDWEQRIQRGLYTDLSDEQQGFGDDFYEERADEYLDYAKPRLRSDYEQQQEALEEQYDTELSGLEHAGDEARFTLDQALSGLSQERDAAKSQAEQSLAQSRYQTQQAANQLDDQYGDIRRATQQDYDTVTDATDRQYDDAADEMVYAMARGGTLRSSAAAEGGTRLQDNYQRALDEASQDRQQAISDARRQRNRQQQQLDEARQQHRGQVEQSLEETRNQLQQDKATAAERQDQAMRQVDSAMGELDNQTASQEAALEQALDEGLEDAAVEADSRADQARQAVTDERQQLSQLVQSGADPSAIESQLPDVAAALEGIQSSPAGTVGLDTEAGLDPISQGVSGSFETRDLGGAQMSTPDMQPVEVGISGGSPFDSVAPYAEQVTQGLSSYLNNRRLQEMREQVQKQYGSPREMSPH